MVGLLLVGCVLWVQGLERRHLVHYQLPRSLRDQGLEAGRDAGCLLWNQSLDMCHHSGATRLIVEIVLGLGVLGVATRPPPPRPECMLITTSIRLEPPSKQEVSLARPIGDGQLLAPWQYTQQDNLHPEPIAHWIPIHRANCNIVPLTCSLQTCTASCRGCCRHECCPAGRCGCHRCHRPAAGRA